MALNAILHELKNTSRKNILWSAIIGLVFVVSVIFVYNNYTFYERPIAKVIKTTLVETEELEDRYKNQDRITTQRIIAVVKNGEHKGQYIELINEFSLSGAYDQEYRVGNELFVTVTSQAGSSEGLTGNILDVKRDKYVLLVAWAFIIILLMVGQKQGLFSVISLAVNAVLLSYALDAYLHTSDISLLFICSISVVLFTGISLILVSGLNEKTFAAIIATLLGTFISLLITYLVIKFTNGRGLRYEEMQFITAPYQMVFMTGLLLGSLGAVMDVAITMSSSIFGLVEENPGISVKLLKKSGMEIGRDIMETMTNILFFVYISGSIPMIILYLKNASPLGFTLSMNLSLEVARALAGGIGIVLTIPIGLYTGLFFVNRKRAKS